MLTVYGRKSSFNLQKAMWLVGELNIAHRHVQLGGAFGGRSPKMARRSSTQPLVGGAAPSDDLCEHCDM